MAVNTKANPRVVILTMRFTTDAARYLTAFSKQRGMSRSAFIREAIREKIEREQAKLP